jgi:SAM-dependent methyltransferase
MWSYAASVLYPAQALRRAGLAQPADPIGDLPLPLPDAGLGPRFSETHPLPVLLDAPTAHDQLVVEFDRMAEVYDAYVAPFSKPIFDEALEWLRRIVPTRARILDAGCGPGRELRRMARLVPRGEVVGIDLAAGMVQSAYQATHAQGLDNTAFFQADVGALPEVFDGQFDVVYCSLAHHHYPQPAAAATSVLRALRPGGIYCVVDPGPAWYTALSAPVARWADPGWIGFHTPDEFRALFAAAGFVRSAWLDLLPGFGLAIGQKSLGTSASGNAA